MVLGLKCINGRPEIVDDPTFGIWLICLSGFPGAQLVGQLCFIVQARRRTRFASLSGALLNKSRDLNTRLRIQNHSLITILAGSRNANSYVGEPTGDNTMHGTSLQ